MVEHLICQLFLPSVLYISLQFSACLNLVDYWKLLPTITLNNITYLLTPWCRVLLEKLTGLQLVKKFPAFYGTRRFITAFASSRHPSLSWTSPIQSTCPQHTSWRSILILSTHLRLGLPNVLFPSGFPTRTLYAPSPPPYKPHAQPISFFSILSPAQYWVRSTDHLALRYAISSLLGPNILLNTIFSNTISFLYSLAVSEQASHPYKTTGKIIVYIY